MLALFGLGSSKANAGTPPDKPSDSTQPNIVYILADDLGYGDVSGLNANGKIHTPNIDRLIKEGMAFTDAHSSDAVCTPSRYGILTGRYCWRSRLQKGVLFSYDPALIKQDQLTVAEFLKQNGYNTACFGKWHLGMGLPTPENWQQPITNGPITRGFDSYFGIPASLDMPPFVFLENDRMTEKPSVMKTWVREGPAAPSFEAVNVLPTLTAKAVDYIHRQKAQGAPFFLYFPMNAPHAPIVPTADWKGKSGISDYADFVMETDWAVGQVLAALDQNKLSKNTIVMFASDNGASPVSDFKLLGKFGHNPSYIFRGEKSDIWEGGHRIPFIVRWPGMVKAGSTTDQTMELSDLFATVADILKKPLPETVAQDSYSLLPVLMGTATTPIHHLNVYHSIDGNFAIQEGQWKLELCPGSGGWSTPNNKDALAIGLPRIQLYDMTADIGETVNIQAEHPDIVAKLTKDLEQSVTDGRSTPGSRETNDSPVDIWKQPMPGEKSKLLKVGD